MQEIAKCPLCGEEPTLKYWDHDSDPSIYHCGATFESLEKWNRYAASIELAQALSAGEKYDAVSEIPALVDKICAAERKVLEVFKLP